jgi:hypothetical protein
VPILTISPLLQFFILSVPVLNSHCPSAIIISSPLLFVHLQFQFTTNHKQFQQSAISQAQFNYKLCRHRSHTQSEFATAAASKPVHHQGFAVHPISPPQLAQTHYFNPKSISTASITPPP